MCQLLTYTYTRTQPVLKSKPNLALKLHGWIETILNLVRALQLANFKIRLPVTDQSDVIYWLSLFFYSGFILCLKMYQWKNLDCYLYLYMEAPQSNWTLSPSIILFESGTIEKPFWYSLRKKFKDDLKLNLNGTLCHRFDS